MHQDSILYNSRKTIPRSVERGFWGRVQQPFCCLFPGMFFYSAPIKHCEAWNHALSHFECSQSRKKVHAFCMDAKGTEGKNYTYWYLERLKYVGIYWTFVKTVLEHKFILGRSCPYCSQVFLPPFSRASSLASFSYFPNPFFLKTTLTPVLPPPCFSYLICS